MGTRSPLVMISVSCFPLSDPLWTSALRRSPLDKWVYPYLATILSHCVPLPDPGPPRTQITGSLASFSGVLSIFFGSKAILQVDLLFRFRMSPLTLLHSRVATDYCK